MGTVDEFNREWITANALEEIADYEDGVLTLRGLHYRLVSRGMTNSIRHYKRVVSAMIKARKEGIVRYSVFSDHDRGMITETNADEVDLQEAISTGKRQVELWISNYNRNRWENQPIYPEVLIEKKALQGVFEKPCERLQVAVGACKGYPSLTFLNDLADRLKRRQNEGKDVVILYFGDYDPSGEDIPRSIEENLINEFDVRPSMFELRRVALMHDQVIELGLPAAPTKSGDSRTGNWDGIGQVELDALEPRMLRDMCEDAINECFDDALYTDLMVKEEYEIVEYRKELKNHIINLTGE